MKRIFSILILATLALGFVACSDDDDSVKKFWDDEYTLEKNYEIEIYGPAGGTIEKSKTIKLVDFPELEKLTDYIKLGSAKANSYIKITGIETGNVIKDCSLEIEGTNHIQKLGDVKQDKTFNEVETHLKFLQRLTESLVNKKEVVLKAKGTFDKEVLGSKKVKVEVKLAITFTMR